MATLAPGGRIRRETVAAEIDRLRHMWDTNGSTGILASILGDRMSEIEQFDLAQLQHVVGVCRRSASLAEAGRTLFNISRQSKKQPNDSDRLRKYLARFGLSFASVRAESPAGA